MSKINNGTWFEVWGAEAAQNRLLKGLLTFFVVLTTALGLSLAVVATRKPLVITLAPNATELASEAIPTHLLQAEAMRVVKTYLDLKGNWTFENIETKFEQASRYVDSEALAKFRASNAVQIKLAKERKLDQAFYVSSLNFNLEKRVVHITADRIIAVDALRAATPLSLDVTYSNGPRTSTNPEGVYIVSEELVQPAKAASERGR